MRVAEWATIRNPKFDIRNLSLPIRLLALVFSFGLTAVVSAQTSDQPEPITPKLPAVRCTLVPTKDTVQWKKRTPIAPATKADQSTESDQIPRSGDQLTIPNPKPQGPKTNLLDIAPSKSEPEPSKTERVTPNGKRLTDPAFAGSVSPYPAKPERQTPNDNRELPIADHGIDNIQSAIQDSKLSTDAWFQISADAS